MSSKRIFVALITIVITGLFINSCKKQQVDYTNTLLTSSPWTLANVYVYRYVGSSLTETDTLNTKCGISQTFTFGTDQSCSYTNFICRTSNYMGQWQFSSDKLSLYASFTAKDTVTGGRDTTDVPFKNAQIVNLGSYSLVLQTGDVNSYFTSTSKRVIKRYSFIHQ